MDIDKDIRSVAEKSKKFKTAYLIIAMISTLISTYFLGTIGIIATVIGFILGYLIIKLLQYAFYGLFFFRFIEGYLIICDECEGEVIRLKKIYNGLDENNKPIYNKIYYCPLCDTTYQTFEENLINRKNRLNNYTRVILESSSEDQLEDM